ncbi:hypothetical protein RF11_01749 [Thelohanellus kitauei]|uniref:Uncharacterized protein n=1 Tax=Thelohanellus kitauei TaxID=669202 RepID=A0A0C2IW00_THEKT|nr:hypothetical protein RF11_01749 [Thelohanellus kitauei]
MHQPETDSETETLSNVKVEAEPTYEIVNLQSADQTSDDISTTRNNRIDLDMKTSSSGKDKRTMSDSSSINAPLKIKIKRVESKRGQKTFQVIQGIISTTFTETAPTTVPQIPSEFDPDNSGIKSESTVYQQVIIILC